jgi:hypothetical protein
MFKQLLAVVSTIGLLANSASAIEMKMKKPVPLGKNDAGSEVFLLKLRNTCNPHNGQDDRATCLKSAIVTYTISASRVYQGNSRLSMLDCEQGEIKYIWNPHKTEYEAFGTKPTSEADFNMFMVACAPYLDYLDKSSN